MAISLQAIRTLTIRVVTQGVQQATAALSGLSNAQAGTAQTAQAAATATRQYANAQAQAAAAGTLTARQAQSLAGALGSVQRALDNNFRIVEQFTESQDVLNDAQRQGLITMQRYNELSTLNSQRMQVQQRAMHQFGNQSRLTRFELINLSRQFQDVGVGLASSQGLFTILIQQGTQIVDVFASSNVTLGGFVRQLISSITPLRLFTVATIAANIAAGIGIALWKSYTLALDDLAKRAGTTLDAMSRLQSAAAFKGVNTQEFTKLMETMAQRTLEASRNMGPLSELFRLNGERAGTIEENLQAVADIISRTTDEQRKWNILQGLGIDANSKLVRFLEQGGAAVAKAAAEARGMSKEQQELVKSAREFEEAANKMWENFKVWGINAIAAIISKITEMWNAMTNFFKDTNRQMREQVLATATAQKKFEVGKSMLIRKEGVEIKPIQDAADLSVRTFRERWDAAFEQEPLEAPKLEKGEGVDPEEVKRLLRMDIERLQVLGELATMQEKMTLREKELRLAQIDNAKLDDETIRRVLEITRLREESERFQVRAGLGIITVGEAVAEVERKIIILLREHKILEKDIAEVRARLTVETLKQIPLFNDLYQASQQFVTSFLSGITSGQSAVEALTNALGGLGRTLTEIGTRRVMDSLLGSLVGGASFAAAGGPIGLAIAGIGAAFSFISSSMQKSKQKAEEARRAAEAARQRMQEVRESILAEINELSGRGWMNDLSAIMKKFNEAVGSVDPATLNQWLALTTQKVIDEAQLTGEAFQEVIRMFPQLAGVVHEFTGAMKRSADELEKATQDLEDRLFQATTDTSSLAGALLEFDRKAMREIEEEIKRGGENLVLLEKVLAAERLQIIKRFADQMIEDEKRKAEERQRILEEAKNFLDAFARKIKEFVLGLRIGTGSPMTPQQQFQLSWEEYQKQLAIITSPNTSAKDRRQAMDTITTYASQFLEAAKRYSPASYPAFFEQIIAELEALPAQIDINELILEEIKKIEPALDEMNLALLNALATGQLKDIATTLIEWLPKIDKNADGAISFDEMLAAFGSNFSTGTLKALFDMMDLNHDGILTQNELVAAQNADISIQKQYDIYQAQLLETMNTVLSAIQTLTSLTAAAVQGGYSLNHAMVVATQNLQILAQDARGFFIPLAHGGFVPGQGTTDSVRAMLTPGEFVVNREAASRNMAALTAINNGYARGGVVANDNGDLIVEVRNLRAEVNALRRVSAAGHAAVVEGIDSLVGTAQEQIANEKLRSARS